MTRSDTWEAKQKRRREFCERFVREHHPGMADEARIKGSRPLVPLNGPRHSLTPDWWLQTNESMSELGFTYLAHMFDQRRLLDHEWMIGRDDHEPWALISEPYNHGGGREPVVEQLRRDLERIGVELLEYSPERSTHNPGGGILVLVANVPSMHSLMGAVARLIVADCEQWHGGAPPWDPAEAAL